MLRRSQTETPSGMSSYHPLSGSEHEATAASPFVGGGRAESGTGVFAASSYFTGGAPTRPSSAAFTRLDSQALPRAAGGGRGTPGSATRAYQQLEGFVKKWKDYKTSNKAGEGSTTPRPAMAAESAARAALALSALGALALFPKSDELEEDEGESDGEDDDGAEDDDLEDDDSRHWCLRPDVIILVVLNLLSLAVAALGVVMQLLPYFHHVMGRHVVHFRWLAFLGGCFPAYTVIRKAMNRLFIWIELFFYRDSLAYLANLKLATIHVVFGFYSLLIFYVIFEVVFCFGVYEKVCMNPAYMTRADVVEKCLLCGSLFFFASWIACVASKVLSTHFYKSTHFKKFKEALNREYILHALSMPKRKALLQHQQSAVTDPNSPSTAPEPNNRASVTLNILPSIIASSVGWTSSAAEETPQNRPAQGVTDSIPECSPSSEVGSAHNDHGDQPQEPVVLSPLGGISALPLLDLHDSRGRPDDKMTEEMVATVPMAPSNEATNVTMDEREDEDKLERLRTAVVVKTYSKLMRLYGIKASPENEERMLRRVRAFSKALFKNMAWNGRQTREFVTLEDFELFFETSPEGRAQAKAAFFLFDKKKDGKVTREETSRTVLGIFNQRATIASSLEDTDSIVQSLESGFAGGLHFLFITFYLLIWKINLVAGFTTFSAIMVGLSFVFGNSIRIMFEALLFLFGEHPYDVGDWVEIEGAMYEIRKVRLLYTVMISGANKTVYMSSKELLEKRITNLSRSDTHIDYMYPEVDAGVATRVKAELKARMDAHIAENPTEYQAPASVILKTMTSANLKVMFQISFTFNFCADDFDRTFAARDSMVQIISDTLAEFRGTGVEHTTATLRTLLGNQSG